MSAPQPRFLETYNSLTDKHLVGYFNNARIRRHLQKSGLISRSGRIIPEKEYRLHAMRRDHQRQALECLANAISHKILDMERHHQREIKRRVEHSVRSDRMQPLKVHHVRNSVEEIVRVHCPHPPLAPRCHHELCPLAARERAGRAQWRAHGVDCCGGHYPHQHRTMEPALSKGERHALRLLSSAGRTAGAAPLRLPAFGRCCPVPVSVSVPVSVPVPVPVPVPPPRLRRRRRRARALRPEPSTARRFYPTTAFNEQVLVRNTRGYPKSPLCSNAFVTMVYRGKSKHVSLREFKDEIRVDQQHCGTENICVYRGQLLEGDTFQFTSKRHLGFPFSLTFYLNGLQVERLSSCCEYRYQRCSQLRGTNSYFRVLHVTGAPPCYRCITAMGLDKKLFPPKKRKTRCCQRHVCCWHHAMHCHPCDCSLERGSGEDSASVIIRALEANGETVADTLDTAEESSDEETENQSSQESEDSQPDISNSEYDEDFEPDEEVNEEGKTGDQMNRMPESSSDDKNHNLDYGKESETLSQKGLQASDSEKDESDGYSDDEGSEDEQQERRPADSLSSMSTQCSTETDSHSDTRTDNVNGKEDCNIRGTSDSPEHAHYGNENGEKKLLRMEGNQETSALEKKGIDEAEQAKPEALTAREDTRIFHENIMAVQHHDPEVNGKFKQTELGDSNTNEEERCPPVPWDSRELNMEDGNEESPWCAEGGVFEDCKPVQEEIAKATGNDHPVNSDPEPGDLCASEEEKNAANTEHDASGAPDGSSLAEGKRSLDEQEAAARAVREEQGTGQGRALEQDGAAEGGLGSREGGGEAARAGDSLPQAGMGTALEESAPEEGAVAEEHPKGKGAAEAAVELGTEVSPGEQEVLVQGTEREVALGQPAAGAEGPAGALPGWEADGAMPRGQEGAGGITEEEEEAAGEGLQGAVGPAAEEEVSEPVSEAGESPGQGGSAGEDATVGAVSEGEEAVEGADVAAGGIARADGPEGEEAVEEDVSEGQEAMRKPGALWEPPGDKETGEAVPGGEGFVKPSEFSQLQASGEEWMETGKGVPRAAALESAQAWEVGGNALRRAEDTMEESVEPDKGPVLEVTPGLGALGGARGDPVTEGSVQEEEEEESAALRSGNPSEGSKAETERAVRGTAEGEVVGGSAGAAGAGSGGEKEATEGAAGSEEPAAGTEGWLSCVEVRGKGRSPGEGVVGEAALPAPGLGGPRAGQPGLVAIAVLGGRAAPGALAGDPTVAGLGTRAVAQEGVTGAVLGAQEVPAKGRAAVGEPGSGGEGVADGAVAGGRAVSQEAAGGCEGRAETPAGAERRDEAGRESGAGRLGSPRHGEVLGTGALGEQAAAETSPSTPARGDGRLEARGRGSTGGEGLCLGTQPQLAETGTARGEDGRQEQGMERAAVKGEGEQPCENTRESEVADVPEGAGGAAGAGEQRKDSPAGASPRVLAAAAVGERSRRPWQDGADPDPPIMSSEQPQDGEETLL
ncbi:glutamate-rich protein 3 isoform X1 [Prinia subflava]|uniref:glutamate-rich protein 3 isoform X1 n=1 Tax=Prinia subflava TaxID=208062 RepID=UPI002FE1F982